MALIYMSGMDLNSATADLQKNGWSLDVPNDISIRNTEGRFGTGSVLVKLSGGLTREVSIAASTLIIQVAFRHNALVYATSRDFVVVYNNSGADKCASLKINTNGSIGAYNAAGTLVETSVAGVVKEGVYNYLQLKIVISDTGSITVKVDGTQVINATSVDTKPGTATDIDKVKFQGAVTGSSNGINYDDFIFMDDSGSLNNDFLGDRRVYTLLPTGDDGTDADFSSQPSQGVGDTYLNVDDPIPGAPDGDTSYNYSNTPGDETLHDFANLPVTPATVDAVQVTLYAKKDDGGARALAALLKADVKTAGNNGSGTGSMDRG
jgi:hypothetical protein